jgi:hypothetical protein
MTTAYIAIGDRLMRERIADVLHRRGYAVTAHATGAHLLADLADVIEGRTREVPGLVVVDAFARGCAGLTIAAGLRDLGVEIPVVLVARPGLHVPASDDRTVSVVSSENAVRELLRILDRDHVHVAAGGVRAADEDVAVSVEGSSVHR